MEHPFKLGAEHLPFPNGGGLKAMANKSPKSQKLEIEALQKKHEVELQKLREKHLQANKPRAIKPMRKKQGR